MPVLPENPQHISQERTLLLALFALGVVFGDIGTSPLYALRECFSGVHGAAVTAPNVLGIVSLILWSLILVVTIKYICIFLEADNRGEGGILALMTLVTKTVGTEKKYYPAILSLGVLGAALLYGDGVLTPAMSVLSAVEGLMVATPVFKPAIVPLSIVILTTLFMLQYKGTAKVGMLFGPVLVVWFIVIGFLGFLSILKQPAILQALNPWHAVHFLYSNGWFSFKILGSAFLALTGAEVMYADLGHFGKKPIRISWFYMVFPALALNYLGQGAYLLSAPDSASNLFYRIVPLWALYPMVLLATTATVIASQAVITGAFSLARQSVQLGFWPRISIKHTSTEKIGQVYVPMVNGCLLAGTVTLILIFRESSNLAAAYGIAVSSAMFITTVLILFVARKQWNIPLWVLIPVATVFLVIQGAYLGANILKIMSGGWVVLLITFVIFSFMKTWIRGREILRKRVVGAALDLATLQDLLKVHEPIRVPGIAVFLSGNSQFVPQALLHNMKHNKILHECTVILAIKNEEIPFVAEENRAKVESNENGLHQIILRYGFSETPDIPKALKAIANDTLHFRPLQTTYFLGREALVINRQKTMPVWRKMIFSLMSRNAQSVTNYFHLPHNRVVELGAQIEL